MGALIQPHTCGLLPGWGWLGAHKVLSAAWVGQDPDITLAEMAGAQADSEAERVSQVALSRALRRLGFTFRKSHWPRTIGGAPMSPGPEPRGSDTASR
ncbi:MAG: hypothetical protein ACKVPY_03840 [Paracoccaceae bacterium]